jgi:hypothetical protein
MIVPSLVKYNKQLQELGWVKKYMDYTFIGTASTDTPLKNMLNRERLLIALEYAMRKSINPSEEISFRVVDQVTPMVADVGLGLIVQSTFMKHLASALGFTVNDIFFMIMASPAPGSRWSPGDVRTGTRLFEDPDDGKFHCSLNPSQWNLAVFNKAQSEILHASIDLEAVLPGVFAKIEIERLKLKKEETEENKTETTSAIEGL